MTVAHKEPVHDRRDQMRASRNDLLVAVANLSGCPDARFILIDLKGGRSARPVLKSGAAEYVVTEMDEARMILRMLVAESEGPRRSTPTTGDEQLPRHEDSPGAVHLMIDETHGLTATEDARATPSAAATLGTVASQGNGVEEYIWVYTQHGVAGDVASGPSRSAATCRGAPATGSPRPGTAPTASPSTTSSTPPGWRSRAPATSRTARTLTSEQIRAPHMPHALLKRIAAQNAALLGTAPPAAPVLRRTRSPTRPRRPGDLAAVVGQPGGCRLHEAFRADSPQYQQYAAILAAESPASAHAAVSAIAEQARAAAVPVASEPGLGTPAEAAARMNEELAACYSGVIEPAIQPRSDLGRIVRTEIERFIIALESAPDQGISPAQLMAESGRAKTWVHGRLGKLIELGAAAQIRRGLYRPMPDADLRRAMATIDAEAARLFGEARESVHAG